MVPISKLGASQKGKCAIAMNLLKLMPAVNEYCAYLEFFVNYGCMFQVCFLQKRSCERFCEALRDASKKRFCHTRKWFTKLCEVFINFYTLHFTLITGDLSLSSFPRFPFHSPYRENQ